MWFRGPQALDDNLTGLGVAAKYLKIRTRPKSLRVPLRVLIAVPIACVIADAGSVVNGVSTH